MFLFKLGTSIDNITHAKNLLSSHDAPFVFDYEYSQKSTLTYVHNEPK
jgi:hypothetical protein